MKERYIEIIFIGVPILVILVGFFFSYLIAELNDAPGFVIIGCTVTLAGAVVIFGIGKLLILTKKNNELLNELQKK
jgi:hypothetical protein